MQTQNPPHVLDSISPTGNLSIDKGVEIFPGNSAYSLLKTEMAGEGYPTIPVYELQMKAPAKAKDLIALTQKFNADFETMDAQALTCLIYSETVTTNLAALALGVKGNPDVMKFLHTIGHSNIVVCIPNRNQVGFINFFQGLAERIGLMDQRVKLRFLPKQQPTTDILYSVLNSEK